MTLQDVFDQLSFGELRTVFLGDITDGEPLDEDRRAALISHVSMGLTVLDTRFMLKEKVHNLHILEGTVNYRLDLPDLLRIEAVRDLENNEYLLNEPGNPESLHTPNYRTLTVPPTATEQLKSPSLLVYYKAMHPKLKGHVQYLPPSNVELDLPPTHLYALTLFIASRVMNPIGMDQEFHAGNNYAAKFEAECQRLEMSGHQVDKLETTDRFTVGGWV